MGRISAILVGISVQRRCDDGVESVARRNSMNARQSERTRRRSSASCSMMANDAVLEIINSPSGVYFVLRTKYTPPCQVCHPSGISIGLKPVGLLRSANPAASKRCPHERCIVVASTWRPQENRCRDAERKQCHDVDEYAYERHATRWSDDGMERCKPFHQFSWFR